MNKNQEHSYKYGAHESVTQTHEDYIFPSRNQKGGTKVTEFPDSINYKYSEDKTLDKLKVYINSTYSQHYVANDESDMQCLDVWIAQGNSITTFRDTIMKYLWRVGKKGENVEEHKKDVMKAIHYCFFLLHVIGKK